MNSQRPVTVDEYAEWNAQALRRQPVSRRSMLKAVAAGAGGIVVAQFGLAGAAFAAAGGVAGPAGVVVSGRHLSFVPGTDGLLQRAMAVSAQLVSKTGTLPHGLRAFVEVGTAPGHYGHRYEADIQHLVGHYAIGGGPASSQYYLKTTITGLLEGALYHYRVRLSDGTVSGDAHFSAPAAGLSLPFTFTAFADVGTNVAPAGGPWPAGVFDDNAYLATDPVAGIDPHPAITQANLMATQKPAFTLLAGDICYADPDGSGLPADNTVITKAPRGKNRFNPYVWDVFLHQIEPQAASTPWMFATGNHDMEALYGDHGYGGHVKRLDMPGNGPHGCPSVYRFTHANVGVLALDANELSAEIRTNRGYSGGAQVRWLEDTLRSWRADPGIDFVVAFFHHCAYSTAANHASDGGLRDRLDPLFSGYQVDLVVQGHNHLLERTDPIRFGRRSKAAPDGATIRPADDGVTYLCVGSGGRPRYPFRPAPGVAAPPPAGIKPTGPQLLPEGQRYRGYRAPGGENTTSPAGENTTSPAGENTTSPAGENTTENIVNGYVWSKDGTAINASGYLTGTRVPEAVDWSQVRYDDYAFIAVDVVPAPKGQRTTFTIRTLADALPGSARPYSEIDRITLERTAGRSGLRPALGRPT
jgi:hypothetical protein